MINIKQPAVWVLLHCFLFVGAMAVADEVPSTSEPINTGMVVIDGKYLPPPYVIRREAAAILINGQALKNPVRTPGGPIMSLESSLVANSGAEDMEKELIGWLDATVPVYEYYLRQNHCYLFFSSGQIKCLTPCTTAFTLPESLEMLSSAMPKEEKHAALKRSFYPLDDKIQDSMAQLATSSEFKELLDAKAREILAEQEAKYGSNASEPVNSGFVIYDGEYIAAPYTLKQVGSALFINDRMIRRPIDVHDKATFDYKDPGEPAGISKYTSPYDPSFCDYFVKKTEYICKEYSRGEAIKRLVELYRNFPFVVSLEGPNDGDDMVRVTTIEGDTFNICLLPLHRKTLSMKQRVAEGSEISNTAALLKDGVCLILQKSGSSRCINSSRARDELKTVVSILESGKSESDKTVLLNEIYGSFSGDVSKRILKNFVVTSELRSRLGRE